MVSVDGMQNVTKQYNYIIYVRNSLTEKGRGKSYWCKQFWKLVLSVRGKTNK